MGRKSFPDGLGWVDTVHGGALDLLIASTLVVGCAGGLWLTIRAALGEASGAVWALVLLALAIWTGIRLRGLPPGRINALAWIMIGLAFVFRIVYVLLANEPAISDFRDMWSFALRFTAADGAESPRRIEELRSLPYLVPLAWVSRSALVYQIGNCLALAVTSLLAFLLARRHLGSAAAAFGVAIAAVAPETFLAAEIPTHDISGTLFLLAALTVLDRLDHHETGLRRDLGWLIGMTFSLGVLLFLLDLQRGLAPFFMVAAGLAALFPRGDRSLSRLGRRVLLMVVLPAATMTLLFRVLDRGLDFSSGELRERHRWIWMAGYASSGVSGTFAEMNRWWSTIAELTTPEIRAFAVAHTISDFADQPLARVPNYIHRASSLHLLGSQLELYLPESGAGSRTGSLVSRMTRYIASPLTVGTRLFLLASALVGLLLLIRRADRRWEVPLLILAVVVAALSLLGERQPRYLFSYWFLMTPVAALPFVTEPALLLSGGVSRRRMAVAGLFVLGAGLGLGIAWLMIDRGYTYDAGRLLPVEPSQIIGTGRLVRDYTLRLDPQLGRSSGVLIHTPATEPGEFFIFARADARPAGCHIIVRLSRPAGTRVILPGGEGEVLRAALPVDTVLAEPSRPDSTEACSVELAFARYVRRQSTAVSEPRTVPR